MTLKGRFSGKTYPWACPVRVTLVKADKERKEVDFFMGEIHSPLNLKKKVEIILEITFQKGKEKQEIKRKKVI